MINDQNKFETLNLVNALAIERSLIVATASLSHVRTPPGDKDSSQGTNVRRIQAALQGELNKALAHARELVELL